MSAMSKESIAPKDAARDDRRASRGLGRLVMAVFWVFGVVTTVLAVAALARPADSPLGSRLVGLLAAVIYILIAVGITHNGRRMRMLAWAGLVVELVGPIITGLLGVGAGLPPGSYVSAWTDFGINYWYLPLILPIGGMAWMWFSDPRRIVEIAEGIERSNRLKY